MLLPEAVPWYRVPDREWLNQIEISDGLVGTEETARISQGPEKAVLMGIESQESLEELKRLAETAGAQVVGMLPAEAGPAGRGAVHRPGPGGGAGPGMPGAGRGSVHPGRGADGDPDPEPGGHAAGQGD